MGMKKYTIITTYPQTGSQNIGDQLITDSLISMIQDRSEYDCKIDLLWREADFSTSVEKSLKGSDAIIFACLAIRPCFSQKEYPFIRDILMLNKPLYVVSSGSALDVSSNNNLFDYLSDDSKSLLLQMDKKTVFFGVRGHLTQYYLKKIGMINTIFTGDIAFFEKSHVGKKFQLPKNTDCVKNIVVSDPHRGVAYKNSFIALIVGLKNIFENANVVVALHGKNPIILEVAHELGLQVEYIYKDKKNGLSIYDSADVHVGFRVHAHVSMLKRRKVSYLLEQDGRGCDYGISLERKISVPCYQEFLKNANKTMLKDFIKYKSKHTFKQSSVNNVAILLAMVEFDSSEGFVKFKGLNVLIDSFVDAIASGLKGL